MGSLALQSLAMLMMDIHWPAKKLICCRVSKISHGHCTTQNFMVFTVHNQSSNMRFVLPMEWGHQAGNVRCNMIKNPGWESCSGQSLGEFLFYIYMCVYMYIVYVCMSDLRATLHQLIILLTPVTPVFAPCLNPWSWSNSWALQERDENALGSFPARLGTRSFERAWLLTITNQYLGNTQAALHIKFQPKIWEDDPNWPIYRGYI